MKFKKLIIAFFMAMVVVALASCGESSFTVKFEVNGGSATIEEVVTSGDLTQPATITKEGYSFAGWYTTEDFSGEEFKFGVDKITADTTLYAKWTLNEYTVTFSVAGATGVPSNVLPSVANVKVNHGQKAAAPAVSVSDPYVLTWYSDSNHTTVFDFNSAITKNTTVYGYVTVVSIEISVLYSVGGTTVNAATNPLFVAQPKLTVVKGADAVAAFGTAPAIEGYEFVGFSASSTGTPIVETLAINSAVQVLYLVYKESVLYDMENAVTFNASDYTLTEIGGWLVPADTSNPYQIPRTTYVTMGDFRFYGKIADDKARFDIMGNPITFTHPLTEESITVTQRFNTQSAAQSGGVVQSSAVFEASGPGLLIVVCQSSSKTDSRDSKVNKVNIETGAITDYSLTLGSQDILKSGDNMEFISILQYDINAAGWYGFGSNSGGAYIFYVQFIPYVG